MTVKKLNASLLPAFPLLLLLLALSTVFLFGNDRGYFYRPGNHNQLTADHLAVAANRSPDHNFLGFYWQTLDADGTPTYAVYNRFPIGGSLLIKLAILPFDDDPAAQLSAARLLMLLFFTATAVLAYLSLTRLTTHRWIALTATLLAFSSAYCLYYNNMVATEVGLDFFGLFLVFHGMVLFVQEGRFRQLLVKTCLALLLGWHVYGLLLPFVVLGLAGALVQAIRGGRGERGGISFWGHLTRVPASLLRSRYFMLGVVALLFGTAVLSANFANEYVTLNGDTDLTNLPSVQSMLIRTSLKRIPFQSPYRNRKLRAWPAVLRSQFYYIGRMSLPYAFAGPVTDGSYFKYRGSSGFQVVIGGILVSGTCLLGLAFVRPTILWATLVLSGFCWGLPMRQITARNDSESLFYIGLPLVLFSLVLLAIRRISGRRLSVMVGLSVAALPVFVLSTFQMARVGFTAEDAESRFQKDVMTDYAVIRRMTVGKVVAIPKSLGFHMRYALAGNIILPFGSSSRFADFVISLSHDRQHDAHDAALLTPDNRRVFLYRRDGYERHIDSIIEETGEPLIHAEPRGHVVDVYRSDNQLYYVRHPRIKSRRDARFFLLVIPGDVSDLPDYRKRWHYDNLDFYFDNKRVPHGTRDVAVLTLPDYDVARIRTGQFTSEGRLWEAEVSFKEKPDDD